MTRQEATEYAVIMNAVRTLCATCAAFEGHVIDLLTGHLWDEEEAGKIKLSSGRFVVDLDGEENQ